MAVGGRCESSHNHLTANLPTCFGLNTQARSARKQHQVRGQTEKANSEADNAACLVWSPTLYLAEFPGFARLRPGSTASSGADRPACAPFPPVTNSCGPCRLWSAGSGAETFSPDLVTRPKSLQEGWSTLHRVLQICDWRQSTCRVRPP
jgi:hypothetical protein